MNQPSDLRERNLRSIFAVFDVNGDGVIGAIDFVEMAGLVCDLVGVTDDDRRAAFKDGYLSWWEQLRADADSDGDGQITAAEFAATAASGRGDPLVYYNQTAGPVLAMMTEAMDHDGDGFIEHRDYQRLSGLPGMDPQVFLAAFDRLDTDGDGRLSLAQFQEAIAHLFSSQNPADPGTAMLGHA
jgi:Ca2+-binding EF-hand superfamily protein